MGGSAAWVEEGLTDGWYYPWSVQAYWAFYAYMDTSGHYAEYMILNISPDATVTDQYQISRSPTINAWNVYWDGSLQQTPAVGFWGGSCPQVGGEVYSSNGHADTFDMYTKTVNGLGQLVLWSPNLTDIYPGMNGISYQNSEWSWNTAT